MVGSGSIFVSCKRNKEASRNNILYIRTDKQREPTFRIRDVVNKSCAGMENVIDSNRRHEGIANRSLVLPSRETSFPGAVGGGARYLDG
jgi:hypothetical protein